MAMHSKGDARRETPLGRVHGVALYVGSVLGSGILLLPALVAERAGPASLLAWGLMSVAILPLALTMALLAARYPGGGGVAAFAREAFGPAAGAATGWLFLLATPIGGPLAAWIGAAYATAAFGLPPNAAVGLTAAILLVAFIANLLGFKGAGGLQVAVVGGIAAILLLALLAALPHLDPRQFTPFAPHGWIGVGQAMALTFWCFVGWEAVTHLSGGFRNPRRDLVPAVLWAAAIIGALYLGAALVTVGTGSYGPGKTEAGLVQVAQVALGPAAGWLIGIVALFCATATVNAYAGAAAHLARALAESNAAPRILARSFARRDVPIGGLLALLAGWAVVFVLLVADPEAIHRLIALPTANYLALYLLGAAAGIRLAERRAERGLAAAALATCALVFPFLGWSGLYPVSIVASVFAARRWLGPSARQWRRPPTAAFRR